MKNDIIVASWNKIKPSDSANNRILSAIIEQNHSAYEGKDMINNMRIKNKFLVSIAACLILIAAVTVIMGIHFGWFRSEKDSTIYKSENVKVTLLRDTNETKVTYYEWIQLNDDIAFQKNNAIIVGEASNVKPAIVSYNYMDTDVSDCITIFDIKVSDILSCRSDRILQNGDVITVGVGYNMNKYSTDLPVIKEGHSYMFFCYTTDTIENDILELSNYVDFWISSPKDLFVEKLGDYYLTSEYFSDAPGSLALSEKLYITEEQIDYFIRTSSKDENISQNNSNSLGNSHLEYLNEDEMDILQTLSERAIQQSATCWDLYNRVFICSCNALEEYVKIKALTYK